MWIFIELSGSCQTFDHLSNKETSITFYLVGYVKQKKCIKEKELFNDTFFFIVKSIKILFTWNKLC